MEKQEKRKRTNEEAFLVPEHSGKDDEATNNNEEKYLIDQLSPHQNEFEQLEKYRIDKLVQLTKEKEYQQMRNKELEILADFLKLEETKSSSTNEKVNPILDEIINSQSVENLVKLNIGGKIFTTTRTTIMKRDNMIKVMLNSDFKIDKDENGNILFSDRNPDYFPIILEHLRTGSTTHIGIWQGNKYLTQLNQLLDESEFFGTSKLSESILALIGDQEPAVDEQTEDPNTMTDDLFDSVNNQMFDDQEKEDEEWIREFSKITLQERQRVDNYFSQVEKQLQKEKEVLIEKEKSLKLFDVTFNIRGVIFKINIEKILKHSNSLFIPMVKNISLSGEKEIFLDRDPCVFSVFFHFIETGVANIPQEEFKKKQLYKEAKLLNLESFLEYFNHLRFPIELIGEENLNIKKEEDILRRMFATDRDNPVLNDPYLHLQSMFGKNGILRRSFKGKEEVPKDIGLIFDFENPVDASDLCTSKNGLKVPNIPELSETKEDFYAQFNAFTFGIFRNMDWNNIFISGGSILATVLKAPQTMFINSRNTKPKKKKEKKGNSWEDDDGDIIEVTEKDNVNSDDEYFTDSEDDSYQSSSDSDSDYSVEETPSRHNSNTSIIDEKLANYYTSSPMWKGSDIDIFLYGLTPEQAEEKIIYLYNLFKKNLKEISPKIYSSVKTRKIEDDYSYRDRISIRRYLRENTSDNEDNPDDIMIFRTEHAITFRFNNPIRCVQIISRIYKSPAEVLIGFDIPSCAIGFDGHEVFCLPRTRKAFLTRCNLVDPSRQSITYETRLVKYALRGFRIGVPAFNPCKIVRKSLLNEKFSINHSIKSVSGLARILLIRSSYKYCHDPTKTFSRIRGRSNLKNAEKVLTKPSEDHDYIEVDFSMKTSSGLHIFNDKVERKINHLMEEKILKKKPYFEFAFNDIERIIKPKPEQQISYLPPKIEWLVVEPGRQSIGSFHPSEKNFFEDAYTQKLAMKRKYKVYWYWLKDDSQWQQYDNEMCVTIEKSYRDDLLCGEKIKTMGLELDFSAFTVTSKGKTFKLERQKQKSKSKLFAKKPEIETSDSSSESVSSSFYESKSSSSSDSE